MAAPVEFRYFHRKFSMEDAELGINPVRLPPNIQKLYCPTVLQYRYRMRITEGGQIETVWSEWQNIPVVIDGAPVPKDAA